MACPNTFEPSFAVALTVTAPLAVAVSKPAVLIAAPPVPPGCTDHVTVLLAAFAGSTAADICNVPPLVVMAVAPPVPVTVIEVTGTAPGGET